MSSLKKASGTFAWYRVKMFFLFQQQIFFKKFDIISYTGQTPDQVDSLCRICLSVPVILQVRYRAPANFFQGPSQNVAKIWARQLILHQQNTYSTTFFHGRNDFRLQKFVQSFFCKCARFSRKFFSSLQYRSTTPILSCAARASPRNGVCSLLVLLYFKRVTLVIKKRLLSPVNCYERRFGKREPI